MTLPRHRPVEPYIYYSARADGTIAYEFRGAGTRDYKVMPSLESARAHRASLGLRAHLRTFESCVGEPTAEGCLPWVGLLSPKGYGRFRGKLAHRFAWEKLNGPVPPKHELHHECTHRACVNVNHLRLVTKAEHLLIHR